MARKEKKKNRQPDHYGCWWWWVKVWLRLNVANDGCGGGGTGAGWTLTLSDNVTMTHLQTNIELHLVGHPFLPIWHRWWWWWYIPDVNFHLDFFLHICLPVSGVKCQMLKSLNLIFKLNLETMIGNERKRGITKILVLSGWIKINDNDDVYPGVLPSVHHHYLQQLIQVCFSRFKFKHAHEYFNNFSSVFSTGVLISTRSEKNDVHMVRWIQ